MARMTTMAKSESVTKIYVLHIGAYGADKVQSYANYDTLMEAVSSLVKHGVNPSTIYVYEATKIELPSAFRLLPWGC